MVERKAEKTVISKIKMSSQKVKLTLWMEIIKTYRNKKTN